MVHKLMHVDALYCAEQANLDPTLPVEEWQLDALANKMKQYCYLLEDLTPELLLSESGGDYEELRAYLRQRGIDAYQQKVTCLRSRREHTRCEEDALLWGCSRHAAEGLLLWARHLAGCEQDSVWICVVNALRARAGGRD